MPKYVIADASVLIVLDKIEQLELLQGVYNEIYTTPEIVEEFGNPLPNWIIIESVKDKKYQKIIEMQVDKGEASAIALSLELDDSLLILDDLRARKLAKRLGLIFTGTLGVIQKAKENGVIRKIKPMIEKLKSTDFRISEKIIEVLLKRNNE
jgi:predicted nucleic acid-binding protein